MSVRPARPGDAPALARLHAGAFADGWSAEDFETWLGRAEAFAVLAESGGREAAFGLALAAGVDGELLTIAADPAVRRAGWARRVFAGLDAEAARRGLERWVLEVARDNNPAISLYKSEGFVEIAVRKAYYRTPEGRVDALVMTRRVGSAGGQQAG